MGAGALEGRVREVIAEVLGDAAARGERLAADSLSHAELVLALEDAFSVRLPDDASLATAGDATALVAGALEQPPSGGKTVLDDGVGRFQGSARSLLAGVLSAPYRLRVHGADRVPSTGPAVLASNHDSLLDIPFLVVASRRPVWFMAKVELFKGPVATWFFHAMGGFAVRRGGYDVRAVRAALHVLTAGRVLGMYPEGTRAPHLQAFLPGAAWIALATGSPLVPVGVTGTAHALPRGSALPRPARVAVRFGRAIEVPAEKEPRARLARARELTERLRSEVAQLVGD